MPDPSLDSLDLAPRHELGLHHLRRWRAGELPESEREQVQRHVDGCAACRERLTQLATDDAHAKAVLPFEKLAEGVARRSLARPRQPWLPRVGLALAAGLALVVIPRLGHSPVPNGIKGDGSSDLQLYVGGVGEPRRVLGDAILGAGERVRLEYLAGDHRYLAVLSIDERGEVSPLYPQRGQSQPISRGEARVLPNSVAFEGQGRERLVAVFSDDPLAVDDLVAAAHADFTRTGALSKMEPLGLGAEEVDRTVIKPGTP